MKTNLDLGSRRVTLCFADQESLEVFLDKSRARGGLTVRLEERVDEGSELDIVMESPGRQWKLPTRVRQVYRSGMDRWGTICELPEASALEDLARAPKPEPAEPAIGKEGPDSGTQDSSTTRGTSPIFAIKELNPNERRRLAAKAGRTERQVLLRDSTPQVLMGLLANPRIESNEIVQLIKNSQVTAGMLKRIAEDRKFTANYEVQLGLVRNPKTPTPIAARLVEYLRPNDLRDMAKGQGVRDEIQQVALRVYLRRTSQR